jgi:hypothetical protein
MSVRTDAAHPAPSQDAPRGKPVRTAVERDVEDTPGLAQPQLEPVAHRSRLRNNRGVGPDQRERRDPTPTGASDTHEYDTIRDTRVLLSRKGES